MRRTLRLFVYAAAMLAVAVGVAAMLKDDPGYEAGRSEISGKLVGLTEYQENRENTASSGAEKPADGRNAAAMSAADHERDESSGVKHGASAPFDTRPAAVASEKSGDDAPSAAVRTAQKSNPSDKEKTSAPAASLKDKSAADEKSGKAASSEKAGVADSRGDAPEKVEFPAKKDADDRAFASAPKEPAAREKAPSDEEKEESSPRYERVVTSAKFSMQGSQIKLVLQGNAPMVGHYFTLADPDRVVLDLAGNWDIEVPRVPSNRLIQSVRVGQHDDKTRIVFDMKTTGRIALVPLNRNSLELRIQ